MSEKYYSLSRLTCLEAIPEAVPILRTRTAAGCVEAAKILWSYPLGSRERSLILDAYSGHLSRFWNTKMAYGVGY